MGAAGSSGRKAGTVGSDEKFPSRRACGSHRWTQLRDAMLTALRSGFFVGGGPGRSNPRGPETPCPPHQPRRARRSRPDAPVGSVRTRFLIASRLAQRRFGVSNNRASSHHAERSRRISSPGLRPRLKRSSRTESTEEPQAKKRKKKYQANPCPPSRPRKGRSYGHGPGRQWMGGTLERPL